MTGKVWIVQSAPFFLLFQKYFVMLYLQVGSAQKLQWEQHIKKTGFRLSIRIFPSVPFKEMNQKNEQSS